MAISEFLREIDAPSKTKLVYLAHSYSFSERRAEALLQPIVAALEGLGLDVGPPRDQDDLLYPHSVNLPIRHRCTSTSKCGNGRRYGSQSGLMALKICRPLVLENLAIYRTTYPEK